MQTVSKLLLARMAGKKKKSFDIILSARSLMKVSHLFPGPLLVRHIFHFTITFQQSTVVTLGADDT